LRRAAYDPLSLTFLQVSTCAGFQAILLSGLKLTRGLVSTGLAAVACRHEMWLPQCGVNLQKGERYVHQRRNSLLINADFLPRQCNMMYSLFKSLCTLNNRLPILHTYDINCQFSPRLWERYEDLPTELKQLDIPRSWWVHLIPKMHLMGHIRACHAPFSLNFQRGAARTCGEAIERMWSLLNGIATSIREMGPGMRSDWIDAHMGHHNWRKHCGIGNVCPRFSTHCKR
jgi:hypothetical protein